MRYFCYFKVFPRVFHTMRNKEHAKRSLRLLTTSRIINRLHLPIKQTRTCLNTQVYRQTHTESEEDETENYPLLETEQYDQEERVKNMLFKNSDDIIIKELNNCASVEGVWRIMEKYRLKYNEEHLAQTILVLKDLQNMYSLLKPLEMNVSEEFLSNLYKYPEFNKLLSIIQECLSNFDSTHLSYILLYLYKMGISVETELMQSIATHIRDDLCKNFAIDKCSKLLRVLFSENSVRPYYVALHLIPEIFNFIGKCDSPDDFVNLTICLDTLHNLVNKDILSKYTERVENLIQTRKLKSNDHKAILGIIRFLNYPDWRYKTSILKSKCMLLLKDEITSFNVTELLTLYEVFFKNEEPGEILNEIQRSAAKFWQNCEEDNSYHLDTSLKIFSALIYFSSPLQKSQFQKDIHKFMKKCNDPEGLLQLRKIFSYVKVSDIQLCERYWDSSLQAFKENKDLATAVRLCQNYMHFNTDIDNYRHVKFEENILEFIEKEISNENSLFACELATFLGFTIVYGTSEHLLDKLLQRFEDNLMQIKAIDCLKISHSVGTACNTMNGVISKQQLTKIRALLSQRTRDILSLDKTNFSQNSILIKAAILRNDHDSVLTENFIMEFKKLPYMSSKMIENLTYIFLNTDSLIPEVINNCTEYIVNHSPYIIGFNAEKLLFICYYLAYYPINAEKFFQVVTDIIIRDQERLSSLAFLQSALSLSFFNRLPSFLVKQIFNVEFMDKLDNELANCYSKDKYSQRVRNTLMKLNRAVCLDYPEFNVPWFHEKYVRETEKRFAKFSEYQLSSRIKEHLTQIAGHPKYILENLVTPYGYHIDFVVSLNKENKIVYPESGGISRKIALILTRKYTYTRFYAHLKGKYQMKKRHLEILGYTVSILNVNEWINLLYSVERLEYLNTLICPEKVETVRVKTGR
ncbi:unnamed protein product [Phaedon cochleariae]|uniref:RAP domain-containing protein n=1 Tax=Phaedon cochleariae TaxID=80249 RepID=A0A9N9SJP2_PHACE|nr:unnamed protein product [Phaedon cochleariae]